MNTEYVWWFLVLLLTAGGMVAFLAFGRVPEIEDEPALEQEPAGEPALEQEPAGEPALEQEPAGEPALEQEPAGEPALEG
jgi:hypothetical protein